MQARSFDFSPLAHVILGVPSFHSHSSPSAPGFVHVWLSATNTSASLFVLYISIPFRPTGRCQSLSNIRKESFPVNMCYWIVLLQFLHPDLGVQSKYVDVRVSVGDRLSAHSARDADRDYAHFPKSDMSPAPRSMQLSVNTRLRVGPSIMSLLNTNSCAISCCGRAGQHTAAANTRRSKHTSTKPV